MLFLYLVLFSAWVVLGLFRVLVFFDLVFWVRPWILGCCEPEFGEICCFGRISCPGVDF